MCRSLNPHHQKRQKDSRSPKPVGIYVAPGRAKRLGLRLSFCRFCLEGFQRPTVLITPVANDRPRPERGLHATFRLQKRAQISRNPAPQVLEPRRGGLFLATNALRTHFFCFLAARLCSSDPRTCKSNRNSPNAWTARTRNREP